jgi:hypothetical protein
MATKQITIISGHDTSEEREQRTRAWLEQHGVTIEEWNGLQVLTFKKAEMNKGQYNDQYTICLRDAEGEDEQSYLLIDLEADPYDTRIEVKYEGSYSCSCKGYGCAKCNEELAAIGRGEHPYAHHTQVQQYKAPALTISQEEAAQLNSFYSGVEA